MNVKAQINSDTALISKDSLEILQELMKLLDSAESRSSYVFANVGIGNRLFSIKNNAINAKQSSATTVIYSPSIGYFNKGGLSVTAGASLLKQNNGFGVSQYSVTPAYDLPGNENIGFSFAYTRYFVKDKHSPFSSPVQNDLFTSFSYKKYWLQPGIAVGYSTGEYKEAVFSDTIINGINRRRYDSMTHQLKAFSMILSAGHTFEWYGLLNQNDGLAIGATLMANAGSATTTTTHKSNVLLINTLLRKGKLPKLATNKFAMQSLGFNIDISYTINRLTLQPQLYLDYYLQQTDLKKFSQVFTLNIGYAF